MIQLTDLEKRVVKEQCQFCQFWQDDKGCQYPGSLTITPQPDCFAKETAAYFIKDKLTHDVNKLKEYNAKDR